MSTASRTASRVVSWLLLLGVVTAGIVLIAVPKAAGARPLTVLSGSMAPTYEPGDVVVVRPTRARDLEVGDVITFQPVSDDPRLTTHRVVAVSYGSTGVRYVTQGDANDTPDLEPVTPSQVKGEVWYAVPLVGYVSVWIATGWLGVVVHWLAVGLVLYGAGLIAVGLLQRRRREGSVAEAAPPDLQPLANGASVAG